MFLHKELATKVTLECRPAACNFRTKLGFKQYDVILTKEQSMLTKIMSSFEGENMQTQYIISGYRISLHFHNYKHAIKPDENGPSDRNIYCEIKIQKGIKRQL